MATDDIDMKLSILLGIAEKVQSYLFNRNDSNVINDIVNKAISEEIAVVAHNNIASETYQFMIAGPNPKEILTRIVELIKLADSNSFKDNFNPINIITKLIDREYMLDVGGTRICYAVMSPVPSQYLLKSFACRRIASVNSYFDFVDDTTSIMNKDMIVEIHPEYNYQIKDNQSIEGGRKVHKLKEKKNQNVRIDILSRLVEYVRNNSTIASGIIFVEDIQECNKSAMNIFFTEWKFKDAIVDYLKLLIADAYGAFSFKAFLHADFNVPYDFRMTKFSCLITDKTTKQTTYLANLYNNATYEPLPCVKSIIRHSYIQMCHPIVKLRMLYIDMFIVEQKVGIENAKSFEKLYVNKMAKAFNEIQTYDNTPTWVGFFIEESYAKLKYNMKNRMTDPINTILI